MRVPDNTNLGDLGVEPGHVCHVTQILPAYPLAWDGSNWAAWVPLTLEERRELQEDGLVMKELLSFGWQGFHREHQAIPTPGNVVWWDEFGARYTYGERIKLAFALGPGAVERYPDLPPYALN